MRSIAIAAIAIAITKRRGCPDTKNTENLQPASPWQFFGSLGWNFGDGSARTRSRAPTPTMLAFSIKAGNGLAVAAGVSYPLTA